MTGQPPVCPMKAARAAIVAHSDGQRGIRGKLPCPVCKSGDLHYEVHYNGHIWGQCNTEGCVAWLE